jgi:phosphohistidine phosphatase
MRHLLLLRHAEAIHPSGCKDHDRPLTKTGRLAARHMGDVLARKQLHLDLALASDAQRTRETLELALAEFRQSPKIILDPQLYHAERNDLMEVVRQLPDEAQDVLIVGHNPSVAEFGLYLADGANEEALRRMAYSVPPGALAIFEISAPEWSDLRWSSAKLNLFLTPGD